MGATGTLLGAGALLVSMAACSGEIGGPAPVDNLPGPDVEGDPTPRSGAPDAAPEEPDAAPPEPTLTNLTQSSGDVVADANINCRYDVNGFNASTQHFRTLPTDTVTGSVRLVEAILPIESATSPEGVQSAILHLHRLTGEIALGEYELLGSAVFEVPDQTLGQVSVELDIEFAAGDTLVVEVATSDGETVRDLRFGHNREPQDSPTYVASSDCGITLPLDIATIEDPANPGTFPFATNSWLVTLVAESTPPAN